MLSGDTSPMLATKATVATRTTSTVAAIGTWTRGAVSRSRMRGETPGGTLMFLATEGSRADLRWPYAFEAIDSRAQSPSEPVPRIPRARSCLLREARVLARRLRSVLAGRPCRVYSSDLRVRVQEPDLATYPDVTVVCGKLEGLRKMPRLGTNQTP